METKAKEIARNMNLRGLYPWQSDKFVEDLNLSLAQTEKERLIELVKRELNKFNV